MNAAHLSWSKKEPKKDTQAEEFFQWTEKPLTRLRVEFNSPILRSSCLTILRLEGFKPFKYQIIFHCHMEPLVLARHDSSEFDWYWFTNYELLPIAPDSYQDRMTMDSQSSIP